jgi:hypothetical protein
MSEGMHTLSSPLSRDWMWVWLERKVVEVERALRVREAMEVRAIEEHSTLKPRNFSLCKTLWGKANPGPLVISCCARRSAAKTSPEGQTKEAV